MGELESEAVTEVSPAPTYLVVMAEDPGALAQGVSHQKIAGWRTTGGVSQLIVPTAVLGRVKTQYAQAMELWPTSEPLC